MEHIQTNNPLLASAGPAPVGGRGFTFFGSGASNEYEYDHDRIASWTVAPLGGPPVVSGFAYDGSVRLTSTGDWDVRHDPHGRLLAVHGTGTGGQQASYNYNSTVKVIRGNGCGKQAQRWGEWQ